ncbi:N-acyl-D-amino-acid deacylase family protein [Woeseia oceani]|uniref:Aminoacylase n=1 Tax=Woeseia oceani TaxID=1548547 RepID=A0A193LCB7_9GAMM|nr:D-aminoacylase [Woeseia oceani]ANO50113.1 aminoacylase [Woeseia oceani]
MSLYSVSSVIVAATFTFVLSPAVAADDYDLLIRGGTIYDGSGADGYLGDLAISKDRIAYVGEQAPGTAREVIDAKGLAVAPGFINMLSWGYRTLSRNGRGESDIRQGVTLEVMGEGSSNGPYTSAMQKSRKVTYSTLGGALDALVERGVSPNVASFVGASTVRVNVLGQSDAEPDEAELYEMRALVREAMLEGAMGVGTALIYSPGSYASTDELVALASEAAQCGGIYISHMRSEGDRLLEAIDELIDISRRSGAPAEIFHLKQAGQHNWGKLDAAIERIEEARASGLRITANMYPYTVAGTGLSAAMPTWVRKGGFASWRERLQDPAIRARVAAEMQQPGDGWENLYYASGGPGNVIFSSFRSEALRPLAGRTLADVAKERGTTPEATMMDLVVEDGSRVEVLYRLMSEDNVRRQIGLPWMSFGSDGAAATITQKSASSRGHPRVYGTFARVLGHYVRELDAMPLADAIRRMTSLPAATLGLRDRGRLQEGYYADIAVFDPESIIDRATVEVPAVYAVGMQHVLVNGTPVLRDAEHTGATPGRVVRGPGWQGWEDGGKCP